MSWLSHIPKSVSLKYFNDIMQHMLDTHKRYVTRQNTQTFQLISNSLSDLLTILYAENLPSQTLINSVFTALTEKLNILGKQGPAHLVTGSHDFNKLYTGITTLLAELNTSLTADITNYPTIMAHKKESKAEEEKAVNTPAAQPENTRQEIPLSQTQAESYINALRVQPNWLADFTCSWFPNTTNIKRFLEKARVQRPVLTWSLVAIPMVAAGAVLQEAINEAVKYAGKTVKACDNEDSSWSATNDTRTGLQYALLFAQGVATGALIVKVRSSKWFAPVAPKKPVEVKEAHVEAKADGDIEMGAAGLGLLPASHADSAAPRPKTPGM